MQQLAFLPPAASPIRRQYLTLKQQHPKAILFFQLGDFYETFEDDARIVAQVCDIALTSREMGRGERLPMAGVPVHAAEAYIARLVERGYHIALCDQAEARAPDREPTARARPELVERSVTRVITPGTLVDPQLLTSNRANYLAAVVGGRRRTGIAHADISTGEFACVEIEGPDHAEIARAELCRIQPAECLTADAGELGSLVPGGASTTEDASLFSAAGAELTLCQQFQVATAAALGLEDRPCAAQAAAAILRYLGRTQPRAADVLGHLRIFDARGYMVLDPATRDHLELVRGAGGRREGSLLHSLDRTRTAMGARLLASWIGHPLLDRAAITDRLDAVSALVTRSALRQGVQGVLGRLPDVERLAGRAAQRLLTPREALALAEGVQRVAELQALLVASSEEDATLARWAASLEPPEDLADDIRAVLVEDPPPNFGEGVIRPGQVPELDELRSDSRAGRQWLLDLERRERERAGARNLKVGYNRVFGYYIEVSSAALRQPVDYYRQQETGALTTADLLDRLGYQRRQTLAAAERFVTPELREHEVRQARSASRQAELERAAYDALCARIGERAPRLAAPAGTAAEVDVLAAYAQVAEERRYVRPEIAEEPVTEIVAGRHPVVEAALGWGVYIPADAHLSRDSSASGARSARRAGAEAVDEHPGSVILLTGPNMAGKTTYGRMVLLVGLMAQCGSFVPADRARLGLVDRIFLRSGAADDIAGGRSTFMVEMTETAAILRNVTPRSLAFFDEVGRGTSTYDGMAIARAIVEYLASPEHRCRTIFSTHYHELAAIERVEPAVRNCRMEVYEASDQVAFTYRVVPGSADRSYGVHVARIAGLPANVVARAADVLADLEGNGPREPAAKRRRRNAGLTDPIVAELTQLNPEELTPIEALNALADLQGKAKAATSGETTPHRDKRRPT